MAKNSKKPTTVLSTDTPTQSKRTVRAANGQLVEVTAKAVGNRVASGRHARQAIDAIWETDDLVKEQVGGFVSFLRENAIVGLAVGFVVGQQAQGVVKQLIVSFIDPTFQLFFGKKLSERTFTLSFADHSAKFGWGGMVYVLLNLVFVLAAIYLLIKFFKLDKLDKPKT